MNTVGINADDMNYKVFINQTKLFLNIIHHIKYTLGQKELI